MQLHVHELPLNFAAAGRLRQHRTQGSNFGRIYRRALEPLEEYSSLCAAWVGGQVNYHAEHVLQHARNTVRLYDVEYVLQHARNNVQIYDVEYVLQRQI